MGVKLELKNIAVGYGSRSIAEGVSVEIESGEVLCLLGPNGAGKTTLFKTLLGLLRPQAGEILIDGRSIRGWSRPQLARVIAYIPQAHNPPFPFKVLDVVLMGRTPHLSALSSPSKRDRQLAMDILEVLNISYLRDRIYTEISGGERQLVLIARALCQQPQILVMDEPTSGLDFGNQLKVLSHIARLAKRGLAVVMASHFPDHAFLYATKVALLRSGKLLMHGTPEEIVTEESLRTLYGVEVRIIDAGIYGDRRVKVCVPVVS
jgi:ABC-type cobalamin/Fe3+-siderophores transport system ATPase subunit